MSLKPTFLAFKKRGKKRYKLSKLGGGWGGNNLDKIQKNSNFFIPETAPNTL